MEHLIAVLSKNEIFMGALGGLVTGMKTDYDAFKAMKSFSDFKTYHWGVAIFRWVQGAIIGGVAGAAGSGLGSLLS